LFESISPLFLGPGVEFEELLLFRMFRTSLTFLATEVGGCGGAALGNEVEPEMQKKKI
jgi:hypothetical protein